jgi:hypothetical protein
MPRRVDNTQQTIIAALRKAGAVVTDIHDIGEGCADILCSWAGLWLPMEIKSKGGKLTPDEIEWHKKQRAICPIVSTPEEAIEAFRRFIAEN